ncbi:MAG: GDP-mannose 4,6-dehydratase [Candidatus Coatesbacteria bacterium]|nr:GDP-mannose 4,6-dehydratase [Candidatus Coatesbacteria bacterium]
MRAVVTGVAGFIGSHLAERLIKDGHDVVGVDSFTPYYSVSIKESNIEELNRSPRFRLIRSSLLGIDLDSLLSDVDLVFHLAAQAGVRASWGNHFRDYTRFNVEATQELLEAAKGKGLSRFVCASSSSVYGEVTQLPVTEEHPLKPVSPYGVTKLAAEHLCGIYAKSFGVPVVSLRFFTVYGPRQRPDMAIHKFIAAALKGQPVEVYGDGMQTRDFTFVKDVVDGCMLAATNNPKSIPYNIGGGSRITVNDLLHLLERILDMSIKVTYIDKQRGDVTHTHSDCGLAKSDFGYSPKHTLEEGLFEEAAWLRELCD